LQQIGKNWFRVKEVRKNSSVVERKKELVQSKGSEKE
jgi:hypothetical protein